MSKYCKQCTAEVSFNLNEDQCIDGELLIATEVTEVLSDVSQQTTTIGMKFDDGKTRLELIPTELIEGVGRVLTFGAQKYEAENWRNFTEADFPRLVGASMRHMEKYRRGEVFDPESGLPHLAHLATNLGFLLALDKRNRDGKPTQAD